MSISLDGRRFRAARQVDGGEVGTDTVFEYHEDGDMVWAPYSGGAVRPGHLVGIRRGDETRSSGSLTAWFSRTPGGTSSRSS